MNRTALLAVLTLLAAVALATAAVPASSPPEPLCSVCGADFERSGDERGVDAMVAQSTVEVAVGEDATARWTVRNRLANESAADRFREDPGLLDEVVAGALEHGNPHDGVSDVSSRVDDGTVVVAFEHESFAERVRGDALVVDYLHTHGGRESYVLDADRFAVVGPDGHVVVNDPAMGRVGDGRVTLVPDGEGYGSDHVDDTYVAFAPDDGLLATAAVRVAFAERALPVVLDNLAVLAPAALAVVVGLAGFRRARRVWWIRRRDATLASGAVLAVGALGVAHPVYAGAVPLVSGTVPALSAAGVVYALAGGLSLWVCRTRTRVPWWSLLAPAVGVVALAGVLVASPRLPSLTWGASGGLWLGVPLAATFPLGYAVGLGDRRAEVGALSVAALAVVAVAVLSVSFASEPVAGGLVTIIASVLVALGLLAALPLYLLGDSLARVVGTGE
ncbi:hypothetical protein NGM10_16830 (plasmid) [Halorussus salilacus]|uniref:hypothetical protein n=1 Tax=Halorussus salilacus TaxID=2953750 RepID=UPI0020A072D5|nr:hypothetical protein [Halorussus salilacus]USZ69761.1 hypothetical protein NGM10_16830 [Halorussus salilacus]